jgi:uncharacterized protein (TIGR02271 family)
MESGEVRVPVAEEQLRVGKREVELGEVEVRKTVTSEEQSVPVELRREDVHVEQVDTPDRPASGQDLFQEGTIRVPIRGEEAVVSKEAVVTGEVVIDKEQEVQRQNVTGTVRREHVEVDRDYDQHRDNFRQHYTGRQGQLSGTQYASRTWEDAEPNYQYGYMAARGEQYGGRSFDEVESQLRNDYRRRFSGQDTMTGSMDAGTSASRTGASTTRTTGATGSAGMSQMSGGRWASDQHFDDEWQHLREEIREGYNRVRR